MESSYTAAIRSIPTRYWLGVALFGLIGLIPLFTTSTELVAIISILYLMIFAITWDVASGYTGALNFGHAFFIAVGGYTTAILNISHNVSPFLSIPAAIVVSALAGVVIGIPALRLRGAYLALVTLVAPAIFYQIIIVKDDIFKGSFGFKTPPTSLAGVGGSSTGSIISVNNQARAIIIDFYITFALMLLIFMILFLYTRSDAGKVLTAIREDEKAVFASGLNPNKHKMFAFILSAATGGLAGAMYVHSSTGFPHPDLLLATTLSLNVIIVSVIGGLGTIIGPLVGGLLFGGFQFMADQTAIQLPFIEQTLADIMPIPTLLIGMVIVYYLPGGLVPWVLDRGKNLATRFTGRTPEPAADGGHTPFEQIVSKSQEELPNRRQEADDEQ